MQKLQKLVNAKKKRNQRFTFCHFILNISFDCHVICNI